MEEQKSESVESLATRFNPQEVEPRIYEWWMSKKLFEAQDLSSKPPYTIILPPPNVTGSLHLGHALDHTIQDCLIRWKRMSGFNALWLPGTDHAGIATQMVVERELKKEKLNRKEMGREKFLERIWAWKEQYGSRIVSQMKRLGDSCDWSRLRFTLDEGVSKAVRKVFVQLYQEGLIYKGTKLINWDTQLESAVSDLEVEHRDEKGSLWHIQYQVEGTSDLFVVATTRPETLLGDTAVAVHPEDPRYKSLIGKHVRLPLLGRLIPIIADTYVDPKFGSGVVKITPAHDFNDYQVGARHNLPFVNILTTTGHLNENAGPYKGLNVKQARAKVLEDLKEQNLLVKEEPHQLKVPISQRTGTVVEPYLSEQWFLKMATLAEPARAVVENGSIQLIPDQWSKTYLHWMKNIEDWCISRQLWWGHRIPAWTCEACKKVSVNETDLTTCPACGSAELQQDNDVLDTWFSSALWPFSTMGWPENTETQKTFYPTDVLVTGPDIIFFWVARMIFQGLHFKKDVPFRKVYFHGIIRDSQGRKMSKTVGNTVDPIDVIEKHGADSLRFTLLSQLTMGRDLKFSDQRLEGYRNFINKLWNATRFSLVILKDFKPTGKLPEVADLNLADRWIVSKLYAVETEVNKALEEFRFNDATGALYAFVWNDFCDWYLEFIKPVVYGEPSAKRTATQTVLATTLNRIVRLLHPMIPFVTEEIYQMLPIKNDACAVDTYPTPRNDKEWLSLRSDEAAFQLDLVKEVLTAVRNVRGENRISPAQELVLRIGAKDVSKAKTLLENNRSSMIKLGRLSSMEIEALGSGNLSKCA
ncbi:MAG: valine--tRNA ligase, partial [Bdellovibrionales bacterium]|nr:valine--tRNA ligase [Bdellovibrionales bacterium]